MKLNKYYRTMEAGSCKTVYSDAASVSYTHLMGSFQNVAFGFDSRIIGPVYLTEEELIRGQPEYLRSIGKEVKQNIPDLTMDDLQHLVWVLREFNPATFSYAFSVPEGGSYCPKNYDLVRKLEILVRRKVEEGEHLWKPIETAPRGRFIRVRSGDKVGVAFYSKEWRVFYALDGGKTDFSDPDCWSNIVPGCPEFHVFKNFRQPSDMEKACG